MNEMPSPEQPLLDRAFNEDFDALGSVIICPGGSYRFISPREAEPVARRFRENHWRPYILRYSIGTNLGIKPLEEAAAALRQLRKTDRGFIALCGFSAGGHLAASLGVHWNNPEVFPDPALRSLQRPDGLALCYPVISAGSYAHGESFDRLGGDPAFFSLETHVGPHTPPAFLWHTAADEMVPVQNSLLFAEALIHHHVPVELHIYPHGVHGLSLATPEVDEPLWGRLSDPYIAGWFDLCINWLRLQAGISPAVPDYQRS